jgi:transposase
MLGPPKTRALDRPGVTSLEALVPQDHFDRRLEQVLDLSFGRDWVKDCYADSGRPSVDPIVFFKLQIVMLVEGIRSERKLIELASLNLAHRWYVGYHLDEPLPDHSTLTRIRQRLGLPIFRRFFEQIVDLCDQAGLVWGKELFFDATKVQANAALESLQTRFAVDEHLRELFATDGDADTEAQPETDDQPPMPLHPAAPVELEQQNADRHDWIAEEGQPERNIQRHAYRRVADFCVSTTDPDATPMRGGTGGPTRLGYQVHDVIDGGRARIILSVLVTPGEVMENQPMLDLLWHTCFRQQRWPDQVTADTTYGTIETIVPIEDAGIAAYLPLPDWDHRTPYFGASRFSYDPDTDTYRCPAGQTLRRDHAKHTEAKIVYQAAPGICEACALKPQGTPSTEGRRIHCSMDETYLDRIRAYHQTEPYQKAMRKRKVWVEPIFAEAKLWHGMRRFRLRRLWRVSIEALMIASVQNLKRLLTWRGRGTRPASGMASPLPLLPENPSAMGLIARWLRGVRRRPRSCQLVRRPISAL